MGSPVGPGVLAQVRWQGCRPCSAGLQQEEYGADCLREHRPSTKVHLTVPRIPQSNTSKKPMERMTCLEECVLFDKCVILNETLIFMANSVALTFSFKTLSACTLLCFPKKPDTTCLMWTIICAMVKKLPLLRDLREFRASEDTTQVTCRENNGC